MKRQKLFPLIVMLMLAIIASPLQAMKGPITTNSTSAGTQWGGGIGQFSATGTFGGGTLSLQCCDSNSSVDADWITVGSGANLAQLTASGTLGFSVATGWYLRVVLTGATSPSIKYDLSGIRN